MQSMFSGLDDLRGGLWCGWIYPTSQPDRIFLLQQMVLFNGVGMVCKVEATSDATFFFSCIVPTLLFIM